MLLKMVPWLPTTVHTTIVTVHMSADYLDVYSIQPTLLLNVQRTAKAGCVVNALEILAWG